jgi:hypothetical protein
MLIATAYWTWWQGALALAALAVVHWIVERRLLAVSGSVHRLTDVLPPADSKPQVGGCGGAPEPASTPLSLHAVFLLAVVAGGGLSAALGGGLFPEVGLGERFTEFFGPGIAAPAVLVMGGALVGFGTRLARGCTSGHGLCGTARLNPPSIAATAAFFGVGVAVSGLLAWGLGS